MTAKFDVLTSTAIELQALLGRQVISSVDIAARYLEQIEKHNHAGLQLNAVISVAPRDSVMSQAKILDDERRQGSLRGPLHGIPILLKDAYSTPTLSMPTTCGSFAFKDAKAKANAKVVDLLIEAGLIVLGKTNMSELGNMKGFDIMAGWSAVGGQTYSPYVKGKIPENATWLSSWGPAGSSSGSAVAVAAGFAPLSLGTESDGSIMMPAARAGLYAIRVTRGTIDDTGVQPALRLFDCLGGFSRNVADLARLTAIMQKKDPEALMPTSASWHGIKIGFTDPTRWRLGPTIVERIDSFLAQTDAAMLSAQAKIRGLGAKVASSIPLILYDDIIAAMPDMEEMEDLNPYQILRALPQWLNYLENGPQTIAELIEFNKAHSDLEFTQRNNNQKLLEMVRDDNTTDEKFERNMKALRETASSSVRRLMETYDVDVIVGPCDSRTGSVGSASGFPTANLPLGFADFNGRAFSLHMIAQPHQEKTLFRVMAAWEATFPEYVRPPPQLVEL